MLDRLAESMTFGDVLTVLSILAVGVGMIWKVGRKDAQFEAALAQLQSHASRLDAHDNDFDSLRQIFADLGKMQAVTDRDNGYHREQLRDITKRLAVIENKRGVLDT